MINIFGSLFVILGTLLWAADTLIRYPLLYSGVSASQIVFLEHTFLVIFVSGYFIINKNLLKLREILRKNYLEFIVIGVFGSALGTLSFTKAFELINPSLVIILQKFQPFVAFILAHFILGEKLKKDFIIYASLAMIGGLLISLPDIRSGLSINILSDVSQSTLFGYGLTLIAVISWGSSTVFGKKLSLSGLNEIEIMSGRFIFGFIFMSIYVLSLGSMSSINTHVEIIFKVLMMVVISGVLGMFFYYKGLRLISSRMCAIAELFFPFCAVVINWIFLNKSLQPIQIFGGLILISASLILQLKKVKD